MPNLGPRSLTIRSALVCAASGAALAGVVLLLDHHGLWTLHGPGELDAITERCEPLIRAIEAYEQANGSPPQSLEALCPELIARIPRVGIPGFSELEYEVVPVSQFTRLHWYDLGPAGRITSSRAAGAAKHAYNMRERALLLVDVDMPSGRVREVSVHACEEPPRRERFLEADWRNEPGRRGAMLDDLTSRLLHPGVSMDAVHDLLGEEDGWRVLTRTRWHLSLSSSCPVGLFGLETLVYESTEECTDWTGEGRVERSGRWALVPTD